MADTSTLPYFHIGGKLALGVFLGGELVRELWIGNERVWEDTGELQIKYSDNLGVGLSNILLFLATEK